MLLTHREDFVAPKPWRDSGTDMPHGEPVTVSEALRHGGLDWSVRLDPLYRACPGQDGGYEVSNLGKVVVRTDNDVELAHVGNGYEPINNHDAFSILDDIVGGREAIVETVGVFGEGQYSWMYLRLPDYITISRNPDLLFEKRLFAANAHTGKQSFVVGFTSVCVVCWNTYQAALKGLANKVSIPHIKNPRIGIKEMREALALSSKYFDELDLQLNTLADIQFSPDVITSTIEKIILPTGEGGNPTDHELRQRVRLEELFDEGLGNKLPGITGSALALNQAVSQFIDHERGSVKQNSRFKASMMGGGARFKARAYNIIMDTALAVR